MRLRDKILLITIPMTILPTLVIAMLGRAYLPREAEQRENQQARQSAVQGREAIIQELDDLQSTAVDWANMAEVYAFTQDGNPELISANISDQVLEGLQVSLLVIFDEQGVIDFLKDYDLAAKAPRKYPLNLAAFLNVEGSPARMSVSTLPHSGLLTVSDRTLAAALAPILRSDIDGPVAGWVLVGRDLDAKRMEALSAQTGLSMALVVRSNPSYEALMEVPMKRWQGGSAPGGWMRIGLQVLRY